MDHFRFDCPNTNRFPKVLKPSAPKDVQNRETSDDHSIRRADSENTRNIVIPLVDMYPTCQGERDGGEGDVD